MTFNIRLASPNDKANDWPYRRLFASSLIRRHGIDCLSSQEGSRHQLEDLESLLSPDLKLINHERMWQKFISYPSTFINPTKVEVIWTKDKWLSETPDLIGSNLKGSQFPRLANISKLKFLYSDQIFYIINTHLDHKSEHTRLRQIKILLSDLNIDQHNDPLIVTGDFNDKPEGIIYREIKKHFNLEDPYMNLKLTEESSFHTFTGKKTDGFRADWLLHSRHFKCNKIEMIKEAQHDGRYPSDHFPIIATLSPK